MRVILYSSMAGEEIAARLTANPAIKLVIARNMDEVLAALPEAEVLALPTAVYDRNFAVALRERAACLRFIQLVSAGYEGPQMYGVPAAVRVANAGDAWAGAVAEHAIALLLALAKRLSDSIAVQRRHAWERAHAARMTTLDGATLCVVGFGHIGREVARLARAFGAHILAVSRKGEPHALADEAMPVRELHTALGRSDAIVLALSYSSESDGMFDAAEFAACKPGALLVNVARGGLVDEAALREALMNGRLGGAALDVTVREPLPADDPLWDVPNLIITPHMAGASGPRGRARLAAVVADNIDRFVAGKEVRHLVPIPQ